MPITWDKSRKRWRYQLHRHVAGKRIRANKFLPEGWSRAEAEEFDRLQTARIVGEVAGVKHPEPLLEDAVALYLKERAPALKSEASIIEHLAAFHGYYAGKTFAELPAIAIEYAADQRRLAAATIKNRLALLRAAARWAWKHHDMGAHDPGERMQLPSVHNERQVYIERRTVLQIARRMPLAARAPALISFYSGMRLSEIFNAQLVDGSFWLADTKNGRPRLVPVHPAIAVYARRPLRCKPKWTQISFMRAVRALELGEIHFHDLRHSAASAMINADVDLHTVGAVLGHKSAQSTKRYAHLAQEKLRDAVGLIGRNRPRKAA